MIEIVCCPYCHGDIVDLNADESQCVKCGATEFDPERVCWCGTPLLAGECPECADDSSPCPSCGADVPGVHEHGVLRHEACGYCAHPSSDFRPDYQGMPDSPGAWVCGACGEELHHEEASHA